MADGTLPVRTLILLALAGLGAQLVDGSLGMAYGVTSTTLLLAMGTNPTATPCTGWTTPTPTAPTSPAASSNPESPAPHAA